MYRRPMSPYNSRVATYLEALERDETVNSLRRQYAHHRSVESQYDDLKYEISKAERQNKKLQQKNLEIQEQYMSKAKNNKDLIKQLSEQIEQVQTKIKSLKSNITDKQTQNEKTIQQIKQIKVKINQTEQQNKKLQMSINNQDNVILTLTQTLDQLMTKKKQAQMENKNQTGNIDTQFDQYKTMEERLKSQEVTNTELRQQLNILKSKKAKLQTKVEQVQDRMKDLKKKYQHAEFQSQKLNLRCIQTQKQSSKVYADALTLKQNIQQSLTKNKDHTIKLKSLQVVLKENINGLCIKHTTKQKLAVQLSDLLKDIQKTSTVIKTITNQTEEQQLSNKGLISNLKKSIQSDEEAVKALTRKAAILNLISQS